MPWPANLSRASGSIAVDTGFGVSLAGSGSKDDRVLAAVNRLFPRLVRQTGIPVQTHIVSADSTATLTIVVEKLDHRAPQKLGDDERYSLEAADNHVRISADAPLGALRGIETFLQLVTQNKAVNNVGTPGFSLPAVSIHDEPRFPWRGLSLDVARHFMPIDDVKRTIDGLAAVKLDVLHLHLSDDEGFRVQSKRYPRLTAYGSDGLFYSQSEVRDLIGYARERGIRIVPEFDMPGHATSWLVGYPKLGTRPGPYQITRHFDTSTELIDPTQESTYRFLDGFIGEMARLFPDEYFHIGGDEVNPKAWNESARVQAFMRKHDLLDAKALHTYFNQRLLKIVTRHRKHMEGWDEILQPDLPKSIVVQSWRGQPSLWAGARQGFQGILSAGYYLDLIYPASYHYSIDPMIAPGPAPGHYGQAEAPDPKEPKPGSPSGLTPDQAKLILGGEAAMWDELATPENLDAKLWPRLAAMAERFWSPESVTDVASMYRRLALTNRWLEWLGLKQRSNLQLMRQRLAGDQASQPLDVIALLLEPTKGYSRNAETYTNAAPINKLVDSIPPESNAAREFRNEVDRYLAASQDRRNGRLLRQQLANWRQAAANARPIFASNSLLMGDSAVVNAVETLCQTGLASLDYLEKANKPAAANWKEQAQRITAEYSYKPVGELVVPIAPGIAKLVEAVSQ